MCKLEKRWRYKVRLNRKAFSSVVIPLKLQQKQSEAISIQTIKQHRHSRESYSKQYCKYNDEKRPLSRSPSSGSER